MLSTLLAALIAPYFPYGKRTGFSNRHNLSPASSSAHRPALAYKNKRNGIHRINRKTMPTPRHVLLNVFWFTAIGPLFGLVACIVILETVGKTPFNAIGILIEEPIIALLLTYISGGPAALLTGIFASFISRGPYRPYAIIAFGALISLPMPLFLGMTMLAGDRSLTFSSTRSLALLPLLARY